MKELLHPRILDGESDRVLVDLAISGQEAAFKVIVRRYQPLMIGHATRILGSTLEAEDTVQDTFVTAWEKLSMLNDADHLKPWLMRILRNKSMDRLRARRPPTVEIDDDLPAAVHIDPFEVVESLLQNQALSSVLAKLPTNQRRAWLMREFSRCSYAVIASELDVPESTVRGLLARSRLTLARELADWR
jgi:RNA polymerase sigma-70 factor (ECF subfamily)